MKFLLKKFATKNCYFWHFIWNPTSTGIGRGFVFEQVIGDLISDELIQSLHGRSGHTSNKIVNHPGFVQFLGIEEHICQFQFISLQKLSNKKIHTADLIFFTQN